MNLTQISKGSKAFSDLEYELQYLTCLSTLGLMNVQEISNPNFVVQYERFNDCNMQEVSCWRDLDEIEYPNNESNIVEGGVSCSQASPFVFDYGSIDLGKCVSTEGKCGSKIRKRYLYAKVAVGKSCGIESVSQVKNVELQHPYMSYYIDKVEKKVQLNSSDLSFLKDMDTPTTTTFVITNPNQILPRFIVECEYDLDKESKFKQNVICDNCEKRPSMIYCKNDNCHLCQNCDTELHSNKLSMKHNRVAVENNQPYSLFYCTIHPDKVSEFFCHSCNLLICLSCKMIGNHSFGEFAKHSIITTQEAYQNISESLKKDSLMDNRINMIKQKIKNIEDSGNTILENGKVVRDGLVKVHNRLLSELDNTVRNRLLVLRDEARECKYMLSSIYNMRNYVNYLKSGKDWTLFVLSWNKYYKMKNSHPVGGYDDKIPAIDDSPLKIVGSMSIARETGDHGDVHSHSNSEGVSSPLSQHSILDKRTRLNSHILDKNYLRDYSYGDTGVNPSSPCSKVADLFAEALQSLDINSQ